MNNVIVITPTIGRPELEDAIKSVLNQTVAADHLIVVDGPEFEQDADVILAKFVDYPQIKKLVLPFNTGKGMFYGHRIIAAISHTIDHEYAFILDDDNWFDNDHIESLTKLISENGLDWAYSFRKVWSGDLSYFIEDNSVSIGNVCKNKDSSEFLVDTSSYAFSGDFFGKNGWRWHGGWGTDRKFFQDMIVSSKSMSSNLHTLNYRLSGDIDFSNEELANLSANNDKHSECDHN